MVTKKFLRRGWSKYSKLGLKRKRKQIWRRPTGRDNKMREKRRGYPAIVSVGHKTPKEVKDRIEGKEKIMVRNLNDLEKAKKDKVILLAKMGKKKKLAIFRFTESTLKNLSNRMKNRRKKSVKINQRKRRNEIR